MDWKALIETKNSPHQGYLNSKENFWDTISDLQNFIDQLFSNPPVGFTKQANLLIGGNVEVDSSAKIIGRVVIESNSKIKDSVLLRDGVIIGENCTIGHASEVKHSIIMNNSNVAHLNYVGDSLVGNEVNLAAGVIIANFKNGSKNPEVSVEIGGKKISTGMTKLGALIGDGTKIGSNVVTDPGTIIGKNTLIYPLSPIRGTIENNKLVKYKPSLEIIDKE